MYSNKEKKIWKKKNIWKYLNKKIKYKNNESENQERKCKQDGLTHEKCKAINKI